MECIPLDQVLDPHAKPLVWVTQISNWRNATCFGCKSDHFEVYKLENSSVPTCRSFDDDHCTPLATLSSKPLAVWAGKYIFDFYQTSRDSDYWIAQDLHQATIQSQNDNEMNFRYWASLALEKALAEMHSEGLHPKAAEPWILHNINKFVRMPRTDKIEDYAALAG